MTIQCRVLQVRQELVNLGGRHVVQEGFFTDEEERSNDAWSSMPWMIAEGDDILAEDVGGGCRGPAWPPEVAAAVPKKILDFLQGCSAAQGCTAAYGCELLTGWAAAGLPGLDAAAAAGATEDGGAAAAADAGSCGCSSSSGRLCSGHAVWRGLCQAWAGAFLDSDLEALQLAARCIARLSRQHADLQAASAAALGSIQRAVEEAHGSKLRLRAVLD